MQINSTVKTLRENFDVIINTHTQKSNKVNNLTRILGNTQLIIASNKTRQEIPF